MSERFPNWEAELWSYISSGDGMHCPIYSCCEVRCGGGWCPEDNGRRLDRLRDSRQFDPSDYDFVRTGRLGRVFELVEMLAQDYLDRARVPSPPVPAKLISQADEQHSIEIRLVPLKAYHGAIWRLDKGWIIQLNRNDTSRARRFTLFHEVFHILAHCKTTPVFKKGGGEEGYFNELLADYFAICVLMPREWVKEKWIEVNDLKRMAEIFGVQRSLMYFRLKHMGLI